MDGRFNYIRKLFLPLLLLLGGVLIGCVEDLPGGERTENGSEAVLEIEMNVPGMKVPTTYGMSGLPENEVREVDVLVFQKTGTAYTFLSHKQGTVIKNGLGGGNVAAIKVTELNLPANCNLVLVANAHSAVTDALALGGSTKAGILAKLQVTVPDADPKWNTVTGSYTPLPMYGELENVNYNTKTSKALTLDMIRMHARIDVKITDPDITSTLGEIHLFNYFKAGYVSPKWDANGVVNMTNYMTVTSGGPNLPGGPYGGVFDDGDATKSILYNAGNSRDYLGEIMAFESTYSSDGALSALLVIQAKYQGTYYYYPVKLTYDGVNGEQGAYMSVLRNHRYIVNIEKIEGKGYATLKQARNSHTEVSNLRVAILQYNESEMRKITYDGQAFVGSSYDTIRVPKAGGLDSVLVASLYTGGFKSLVYESNGTTPATWMQFNPAASANLDMDGKKFVRFNVNSNPNNTERKGILRVEAGQLTHDIVVIQSGVTPAVETPTLTITDINGNPISLLEFKMWDEDVADPQYIFVTWTPSNIDCGYTNTTPNYGGSGFTFDTAKGSYKFEPTGIVKGGAQMFKIVPTVIQEMKVIATPDDIGWPYPYTDQGFDPDDLHKESNVKFTVSVPGGSSMSQTIKIRQKHEFVTHCAYAYMATSYSLIEDVYYLPMDGIVYELMEISATHPWTLTKIEDADNIFPTFTSQKMINYDNPQYFQREPVRAALIAKSSSDWPKTHSKVVFRLSVKDGVYPDRLITLCGVPVQPEANSYIVKPNTPVCIPITQPNKALGDDWISAASSQNRIWDAKLVWSDNPNGIAANSSVKYAGSFWCSNYLKDNAVRMIVTAGSAEGNAVVAATDGNDIPKWSWHIWTTNYEPSGTWMDRNLGATATTWSVTPGDNTRGDKVMGLYYQWGRKDPFPNTDQPAYGTAITTGTTNTLQASVQSPTMFIVQTADWKGSVGDASWGNGTTKTVYDPCPPGWMVPKNTVWSSLTNANFPWTAGLSMGRTSSTVGGFYPAAGRRQNTAGYFSGVGTHGMYWSANPSGTNNGADLSFFAIELYPGNSSYARSEAMSIRCTKQ